jgi:hypothetical protein
VNAGNTQTSVAPQRTLVGRNRYRLREKRKAGVFTELTDPLKKA